MSTILLTKEKQLELENELTNLQVKGRAEVAQKIADARCLHCDLTENADYDAAKNEQGMIELKISKLAMTLANSKIIDKKDFTNDEVGILSIVKIKNIKLNKLYEYQLVSDAEADFEQNKLSTISPLGKALFAKKKGDIAELILANGTQRFEIIEIK